MSNGKLKQRMVENSNGVYESLKNGNLQNSVLYYFKASIVHIAFEAVITVLYVSPHVIYSSKANESAASLSLFFGKVMFNCASIFAIVILAYLFLLVGYILVGVARNTNVEYDIATHIERLTTFGILIGFAFYCLGGVVVGSYPESFAGISPIHLTPKEEMLVVARVSLMGLLWAIQSMARYYRVSLILYEAPIGERLNLRLINIALQTSITCIVALLLIHSFKIIPIVHEAFDYYNLVLVIYFGIFSAYCTACYKLEISGNFPEELHEIKKQ